jgi:hypothetical protein
MRKRVIGAVIATSSLLPALSVQAAIEDTVIEQKKEIEQLREEIKSIKSIALANTAYTQAVDNNMQQALEAITFSAFISAGMTKTDQALNYRVGNIDNDWSFKPDAIVGMQFGYKVNDKTELVTQLVAKGHGDWEIEAEWAYLAYKISDNLTARAGKLRLPIYMYSDYLDVGYAMPWVRPPTEVYNEQDINTIEGIDLVYQHNLGEWDLTVQGLYGNIDDSTYRKGLDIQVEINNEIGLNATISNGDWTFRIGRTQGQSSTYFDIPYVVGSNITSTTIYTANNERFTFSGLGFKYDANNILAIAEFTKYDVDNTRDLINTEGYYLTGGYKFDRLMPHITYGRMYNPDDSLSRAGSKSEQTTITAGLRYELNTKIAIKAEVSKIDGFNGTSGLFDPEEGVSLEDSANMYSIVVDAIF